MKPAILLFLVLPLAVRADDLQSDLLDSLDRAAKRLAESPGKVDDYVPKVAGNIGEVKTDAVALLKGLPYVADARSVFKAGHLLQPPRPLAHLRQRDSLLGTLVLASFSDAGSLPDQ